MHLWIQSERKMEWARLVNLIGLIARKDQLAMAELHRQTRESILQYVRRLVSDPWDGEDVVQDVYAYVWLNASRYSAERGSPIAWLLMIARCRALDALRSSGRKYHSVVLDENSLANGARTPEVECDRARSTDLIGGLVSNLPNVQRDLVRMAFYDEYSHRHIAALTGLPLGTVKTRIRHGLRSMRQALAGINSGYSSPSRVTHTIL